jgi:hypothetical protein
MSSFGNHTPPSSTVTMSTNMPLKKTEGGERPARKLLIFSAPDFICANYPGLPIVELPSALRTSDSPDSLMTLPVQVHTELANITKELNYKVSQGAEW